MVKQQDSSLVLIVDDHEPAADMISHIFRTQGYETKTANSGSEALEKAQQLIPDLVLLDIMMPGMTGYDVLKELRKNPATIDIPVIFVTAKDAAEDIELGLQAGADDYITKPVKPREVIARAKSKISEHRLRDTLKQRTKELEALLRFSEELNNHIEVDRLLELILYLVLDLIPCHVAAICRINDRQEITDVHIQYKQVTEDCINDAERLMKNILKYNDATLIWNNGEIRHCDLACGMSIKLQHIEELHGVLAVLSYQEFSERHKLVFEAIGRQTTLALRNAILYARTVNYAEHLEEMVEERTRELRSAQELLIRSEKLASIGQLAAGLAHEINNPLMPIRINLEGMLEDIQNGVQISERDIQLPLNSVNRIIRIVERLQQFTRHGKESAPEMEPLAISSVMETVMALSETYMRHNKVKLDVAIDSDAYVYGNRDQLEQVFLNIILNAQAAMGSGGSLTIRGITRKEHVQVSFEDTGHGIPEEMLDKIFDPFETTKENGSGLGLFISHNVIHNHSGTIQVESVVGKGTKFTLTLPTIAEDEEA